MYCIYTVKKSAISPDQNHNLRDVTVRKKVTLEVTTYKLSKKVLRRCFQGHSLINKMDMSDTVTFTKRTYVDEGAPNPPPGLPLCSCMKENPIKQDEYYIEAYQAYKIP